MSIELSSAASPRRRYAVIFRTHFWDAFAQRQLDRLLQHVTTGDVFVLVDETHGRVDGIAHDRIVRVTERDALSLGLPAAGLGNMFWFNGDYPLYCFRERIGHYDYYLQLEYDVSLNTDVDSLVERAAADDIDFVGLTKGEPVAEWAWRHTCQGVYEPGDLRYQLICLSLFSNRSLAHLFARRLEMADQFRSGTISNWPFCEGFIATEMRRDGFRSAELSAYVDTAAYDTWPPFVEADLALLTARPVIHPVLDPARYVSSLLKYKVGLIGYVNINSVFHRKLRRLPPRAYLSTLVTSFSQKVARTLRLRRRLAS